MHPSAMANMALVTVGPFLVMVTPKNEVCVVEGGKGIARTYQEAKRYSDDRTSLWHLLQRENCHHMAQRIHGMDIVSFYDADDDNFGWACNLDEPMFSEWGYIHPPQEEPR